MNHNRHRGRREWSRFGIPVARLTLNSSRGSRLMQRYIISPLIESVSHSRRCSIRLSDLDAVRILAGDRIAGRDRSSQSTRQHRCFVFIFVWTHRQ